MQIGIQMSIAGIILLLIGILIFIASFVIPEKKNQATEADKKLSEELAKESIEQEVEGAKTQIQDMVDETVSYAVEKTERSLERLTNEKIQAVNDYSDTVLEEINKNHKEVLFLYDMLNDKQQNLQETVKTVNKTAKDMKDTVKTVEETAKTVREKVDVEEIEEVPKKTERKTTAKAPEQKKTSAKKAVSTKSGTEFKPLSAEKISNGNVVNDIDIMVGENGKNNNERILELHKMGKSNMAVAKELGLGVGEVKLVIDLFEGLL